MSRVALFLTLCAIFAHTNLCNANNTCRAPANKWGDACSSSTTVSGKPGHRIMYTVTLKGPGNGQTKVCCRGYSPPTKEYLSIGCGSVSGNAQSTISRTVAWGNHTEKPKIQCRGDPLATDVTWKHSNVN